MDNATRRFRDAADRENHGRRTVRRRYSKALQADAVRYYRAQAREGTGLRDVAVRLGVAPWSLYRWMQRSTSPRVGRLQRVDVVADAAVAPAPGIVVVVTSAAARVEGLDVEAAARLVTLLR